MTLRNLLLLAATAAMASHAAATPAHALDRHVLHHCEDVVAHGAKAERSATASRTDAAEVERCQMVIREFVSRESRMTVDQNGKAVR